MVEDLLAALLQNGRISSRRFCTLKVSAMDDRAARFLRGLYESADGGAVVLRYRKSSRGDTDEPAENSGIISAMCATIKRNKNKVLTILCFPAACAAEKEMFLEKLSEMTFVELGENLVGSENASEYLQSKSKADGLEADERLLGILKDGQNYYPSELSRKYDTWYSEEIRNKAYPQYRCFESSAKVLLSVQNKSSAFDKLMSMVGLREAKSVICKVLDYHKIQSLYREKNVAAEAPSMHMVFTGSPGTAKTTVARLFAEIMKDNRILSKGQLVDVGRADLVGKYVGWTAGMVRKKFREAQGGVLFIDEAYALTDDREDSFGDEAVNTIVQKMENERGDLVVIFAGYPDKMEEFLSRNPGLSSRLAFHVDFADYTPEELTEITRNLASEKGFIMADGVNDRLMTIYRDAQSCEDFGNGRYARNVLERAAMEQAGRLLRDDTDELTALQLRTLLPEDFTAVSQTNRHTRKIGFGNVL